MEQRTSARAAKPPKGEAVAGAGSEDSRRQRSDGGRGPGGGGQVPGGHLAPRPAPCLRAHGPSIPRGHSIPSRGSPPTPSRGSPPARRFPGGAVGARRPTQGGGDEGGGQ